MGPWDAFVERISSKLAFFPPQPTYAVEEHKDGTGQLYIRPLIRDSLKVLSSRVALLQSQPPEASCSGGGPSHTIVSAFVPYNSRSSGNAAKLTVLYSHGNAVDLGQMMPVFKELSRLLRVNVMGYDYSGYGMSKGTPTVRNTLNDINAVFKHLMEEYKIPASNIILYGQSVGSGPTAWLAARTPNLGGVIFHSPLLSGIRVLSPGVKWWPAWADVYPNHTLAPQIKCPGLVMHGTCDEVIDISCGKQLYELLPEKATPLWAEGHTHQNVEMHRNYIPILLDFISRVSAKAADIDLKVPPYP